MLQKLLFGCSLLESLEWLQLSTLTSLSVESSTRDSSDNMYFACNTGSIYFLDASSRVTDC